MIRDARYSEVVGAHVVGPDATELIGEFVVARHLEIDVVPWGVARLVVTWVLLAVSVRLGWWRTRDSSRR